MTDLAHDRGQFLIAIDHVALHARDVFLAFKTQGFESTEALQLTILYLEWGREDVD